MHILERLYDPVRVLQALDCMRVQRRKHFAARGVTRLRTRGRVFNHEALSKALHNRRLGYRHMKSLGGLRHAHRDSKNLAWRNASFRGYADYMQTTEFEEALESLVELAQEKPTAIMCAEAVWWRCHRSLISDYLKARGIEMMHILGANKVEPHPYTPAAQIVNGELSYKSESLL